MPQKYSIAVYGYSIAEPLPECPYQAGLVQTSQLARPSADIMLFDCS